jgi:hypothetical protein
MGCTIEFRVKFPDTESKGRAMNTVRALKGVDNADFDLPRGPLERKLTVTGDADTDMLMNILKIFGSAESIKVPDREIRWNVTFLDLKSKDNAMMTVRALKGVVSAYLDEKHHQLSRKLTVIGHPDNGTLTDVLKIFTSSQRKL